MTEPNQTAPAPAEITPEQQAELETMNRRAMRLQRELQTMPDAEHANVFYSTVLGALMGLVTEQQFDDVLLRCNLQLEANVQTMRATARANQARNVILTGGRG